jgi:hypothetical protein
MTAHTIPTILQSIDSNREAIVPLHQAVIAGWTGRDRYAVQVHIDELAALGVRRPTSVPVFYRTSATRVTTANCIEVLGEKSSGEVEFVLLQYQGVLWLGAGSDHTDRDVEIYSVDVSKQMCEKPVGILWWKFAEVEQHWDSLFLRSYIGSDRVLYQEGSVSSILDPAELINHCTKGNTSLPESTVMFCGTLPAIGGVRPSPYFAFELEDPVLRRSIQHEYRVKALPMAQDMELGGTQ